MGRGTFMIFFDFSNDDFGEKIKTFENLSFLVENHNWRPLEFLKIFWENVSMFFVDIIIMQLTLWLYAARIWSFYTYLRDGQVRLTIAGC
jgi:hypothetical protein